MKYEFQGMCLECRQIIRQGDVNDVLICQDTGSPGKIFYTVLVIKEHTFAKRMIEVFEEAALGNQALDVKQFSFLGQYIMAFPYKQERPLADFYMGQSLQLWECEEICINVILSCITCGLPYPLLYLLLEQRLLSLAHDKTVFFNYGIDLTGLDKTRTERDCTTQCARILQDILDAKASQKATSRTLLEKKIAKRSYSKFTELYKDITVAASAKTRRGLIAFLRLQLAKHKSGLMRVLIWICILLAVLMIFSFITQMIFGDVPWLRFFYNGFKTIGKESLLQ